MHPNHSTVVAIIQARLGSSRLPGKSSLPLPLEAGGSTNTILGHVVRRARQARGLAAVVLATTTQPLDDELECLGNQLEMPVHRGDEHDVLARFVGALALAPLATAVVRLTADNPAIDPHFINQAVEHHLLTGADYTYTQGLPLGTNIEVVSATALVRAHQEAWLPHEREHVTPYLRQHPELFKLETLLLTVPEAVSSLRLTVDYPSDYALLSLLFEQLGADFSLDGSSALTALLARYPWLMAINSQNEQVKI